MKFSSLNRRRSLSIVLILAALPMLVAAQDRDDSSVQARFSTASLCGNYGAIATYGANVARALGFEIMDGHGKISGTYTINPEGIGTMNLTIALPGGATANVAEDFVVTRSKKVDGVDIATEIQDAQEVPSAVIDDSSLVIHAYTLRGAPRPCGSGH